MKQKILAVILLLILIVVDIYVTSGLGHPPVPRHLAVTMADYFTNSFFDWAGLVLFNAIWAVIAYASLFGKTLAWEEKGSLGISIAGGFVASALLLALIYA